VQLKGGTFVFAVMSVLAGRVGAVASGQPLSFVQLLPFHLLFV
jgi:hypothetical protein